MKLIIDIDDNLYTRLFNNGDFDAVDMLNACAAIRKGTPLPKGHGRLIDVDDKENLIICFDDRGIIKKIEAPTIIEADKEN